MRDGASGARQVILSPATCHVSHLMNSKPPAARSRPEAAQGAARTEGTAGIGAHPQRPRRRGMEAVPERIDHGESERIILPPSIGVDTKRGFSMVNAVMALNEAEAPEALREERP